MNIEDENYDKFNNDDINNLNKLNYTFNINERFIHVKDNNGEYFTCKTPFLKILKPMHITLNKKKTIAKKYLILETNDELDFNNQIGEFMFIINKIHEISQEKIRYNSMVWFNTEFDDIGLDIKVRRPIDQQRDSEFIKLTIPKNIENDINLLTKGNYILCDIIFKGLKISSEHIMEEWELKSFITQEKYDELQNEEFICNSIVEVADTLLENDLNEIIEPNDKKEEFEKNIENNQTIIKDNINNEEEIIDINNEEEIIDINNEEEIINMNDITQDSNIVNKNNKEIIKPKKINKSKNQKIKENKMNKNIKYTEPIRKLSKKLIFT
jgi:hypothetical protein